MAKKNKKSEDLRFAIKLATIGIGGPAVLDKEFLKCVCQSLEGSECPESELEYIVDGFDMSADQVDTNLILYDLVIYSYNATGKKKKVFEAHRGDYGKLYVTYMELTKNEANDIVSKLHF